MKEIKQFFETEQDYQQFIDSMYDVFDNITYSGSVKIKSGKTIGGSAVVKVLPFRKMPTSVYWVRIDKMTKATLD